MYLLYAKCLYLTNKSTAEECELHSACLSLDVTDGVRLLRLESNN